MSRVAAQRTIRGFLGVVLLACLPLHSVALAQEPSATRTIEYRFREMGIEFRLLVCGSDQTGIERACKACRRRVGELNRIFSDYQADSEVCRLHAASVDEPTDVSPELYALVDRSRQLSQATGGAFDITVGPLTRLWREARRGGQLPPAEALANARQSVGWEKLDLDPPDRLRFRTAGMQLDFGGIGQGHAADVCLKLLADAGFPAALVDASGDLAIGEPPPARPAGWRVGVAADAADPTLTRFLELTCCGVSTSGDDQQHLQRGADRLSHILDPRSGEPLVNAPRITVIASHATTADAYASALSVLPTDEGQTLVERTPEISALWSFRQSESNAEPREITSARFPKFVSAPDR